MNQDPDQIRSEIEQTRAGLATDVNLLTEKVSPARVVERRVDSAKEAVGNLTGNLTGRVFGRDDDPQAAPGPSMAGAVDAVRSTPEVARDKATGSPLIAGALAFGAGYLLATVLPASQRERAAASTMTGQLQDLKEPLQQQAQAAAAAVKQDLQPQVEQAAAAVKDTAAQAVGAVKDRTGSGEAGAVDDRSAPRFTPYPADPLAPTSDPLPGGPPPR